MRVITIRVWLNIPGRSGSRGVDTSAAVAFHNPVFCLLSSVFCLLSSVFCLVLRNMV